MNVYEMMKAAEKMRSADRIVVVYDGILYRMFGEDVHKALRAWPRMPYAGTGERAVGGVAYYDWPKLKTELERVGLNVVVVHV